MAEVRVEVIRVRGVCNAGLEEGDSFLIKGLCIIPQGNEKACQVAFASIIANSGRLGVLKGPFYISCPDPGTGEGGNIIFRISAVEER